MTYHVLPPITLSSDEADRLSELAGAAAGVHREAAAFLEQEISRAAIIDRHQLPADVVRLGSWVQFRDDQGSVRDVTLVLPNDADVNMGRISVLTPVGAALIGMKAGQSIEFDTKCAVRRITVVAVHAADSSVEERAVSL